MTGAPLNSDEDRQVIAGGLILSALEAELLEDDPALRAQLTDLANVLFGWSVAADHAVAVRLRMLDPTHAGYTPADLSAALSGYRFARGEVLSRIHAITELQGDHWND